MLDLVDFVVDVPAGRDPVILQLTDTQIIDSAQARYASRLSAYHRRFWATNQIKERCCDYIMEIVTKIKPDVILLTGDVVYGEFDDSGTALTGFVNFMESFGIPWAPVFGNHDNESTKGADWQSRQFEQAKYCLFKQRQLTGNGNYTIGITQSGKLLRVVYMLDSNGCADASSQSKANGHTKTTEGFGQDQINWFSQSAVQIRRLSSITKFTFAFHIQPAIFADAFSAYGFTNSNTANNQINSYRLSNRVTGDFGYLGANLKTAWDTDKTVWNLFKQLNADSVLVGHEHCNSASVVYEGIRCQYGQKSSTYDRYNAATTGGTIIGMYPAEGSYTPLIGGTVMVMAQTTGAFKDSYIYLCENAGGKINRDTF